MDHFLFDETISFEMMIFMGIILVGVLGLNLFDVNVKEEENA